MKNLVRHTMCLVLVVAIVGLAIPLAPRSVVAADKPQDERLTKVKNVKVERGPELAVRLKKLKETNKNVRAALWAFEKRGHKPKLDEAMSITGTIQAADQTQTSGAALARGMKLNEAVFRKASLIVPQQTTLRGDYGIELIFITTLDMTYEWQGTVIANRYDDYGNLLQQYVADTVLTASNYNSQEWMNRYEVSYENGQPYLMHEPGMYSGFALGVPIQEHQAQFGAQAPLDLESWQFATPEQQQQYYDMYPQQIEYDRTRTGRDPWLDQPVSRVGGAKFMRASFQARSDRAIERHQMRCGNTGCGPTITQAFPGLGQWTRSTGVACGAAAGGCGLASALFAGTTFGPCFVSTCAGAAIYNAAKNIFGMRIN